MYISHEIVRKQDLRHISATFRSEYVRVRVLRPLHHWPGRVRAHVQLRLSHSATGFRVSSEADAARAKRDFKGTYVDVPPRKLPFPRAVAIARTRGVNSRTRVVTFELSKFHLDFNKHTRIESWTSILLLKLVS